MDALANLPIPAEAALWVTATIAIMTRLSLLASFLPAIGDTGMPMRVRMIVVIVGAIALVPMVIPAQLSAVSRIDMVALVVFEGIIGFALGFGFRIFIFALVIAGTIMAQAMSLSQIFGNGIDIEPNPTVSSLLMITGTAMFVTLDGHTQALGLIYESYVLFPLGDLPASDALARWATDRTEGTLRLAVSLALPFLLISFLYNAVLGLINQAMPQMMVTFVGVPANVMAGIVLLGVAISTIIMVWADRMFEAFGGFW